MSALMWKMMNAKLCAWHVFSMELLSVMEWLHEIRNEKDYVVMFNRLSSLMVCMIYCSCLTQKTPYICRQLFFAFINTIQNYVSSNEITNKIYEKKIALRKEKKSANLLREVKKNASGRNWTCDSPRVKRVW